MALTLLFVMMSRRSRGTLAGVRLRLEPGKEIDALRTLISCQEGVGTRAHQSRLSYRPTEDLAIQLPNTFHCRRQSLSD